jgi:hypothetical protein
MEVSSEPDAPPALSPGIDLIGGWVGPDVDVVDNREILDPPGNRSSVIQTVDSHVTDWTVPAHECHDYETFKFVLLCCLNYDNTCIRNIHGQC